jgi:hypothetical protein
MLLISVQSRKRLKWISENELSTFQKERSGRARDATGWINADGKREAGGTALIKAEEPADVVVRWLSCLILLLPACPD